VLHHRVALTLLALSAVVVAGCGGSHHRAATPAAPSATPTPSPTPSPVDCPLTGTPVGPGQSPHRPALAVKIDNIDLARPQSGIDKADVVFEEMVEGGLTRLFAVFQCDSASTLGPIRSARTTDAALLALLHGSVFGYSGANPAAMPQIRAHGDTVLIPFDNLPQYFHRVGYRPAPHNVYSDTKTILDAGLSRRHNLTAPKPLFLYGDAPTGGTPAKAADMRWPAASAGWRWNGSTWLRLQNGTPDRLANGARVHATNVVIMQVPIAGTGIRDVAGNASPNNVTLGSGPIWVLRDGQVYRGTWHRAYYGSPLRFTDASGAPLLLHPGRTWVELLPRGRTPTIS
jgi:hypothetical protein